MRPLLEITTTPVKYEYEIERPKLVANQERPTVERTIKPASLSMKREFGHFEMNTTKRRSDMGFKGIADRASFEGDKSRQAAFESIGNYAELGNAMLNIQRGGNIPDALWNQMMKHSKGDLVLVPLSPLELNYVPAKLAIDFSPGEIKADWNVGKARLDFVPGSFGLKINQYASIEIEYTGGPVYAPPSADPNFEAKV